MDDIKNKLSNHDLEISYIKKSLDHLVEYSKDTNVQIQKIGESISKQEVILEKLANLENNYDASVKRVHKRIDMVEKLYEKLDTKADSLHHEHLNKPCMNKEVFNKSIEHLEEKINNIKKIFWGFGSTVGVIIIGAILDMVLNKGGH